ncbi:hypothetical protein EI94DRAFT_1562167, partial [Lactarius quietus]
LIHSMKRGGLPEILTNFAGTMLNNRSTMLRFDDHISEAITLDNGIGQRDTISMALYQFYNTDILEIPSGPFKLAEV